MFIKIFMTMTKDSEIGEVGEGRWLLWPLTALRAFVNMRGIFS